MFKRLFTILAFLVGMSALPAVASVYSLWSEGCGVTCQLAGNSGTLDDEIAPDAGANEVLGLFLWVMGSRSEMANAAEPTTLNANANGIAQGLGIVFTAVTILLTLGLFLLLYGIYKGKIRLKN